MEGVLCLLCQTVVLSVISRLGTQALRVSGYSANVMNYLTIPANAFAIAAATIIGLALGAGSEEKARQCLRRSLLLALSATVVLAAAALLLGRSVLRLYVADAAILVSSLKAIGNVRTPLLMALLGSALNISVSWLLGIRLGQIWCCGALWACACGERM